MHRSIIASAPNGAYKQKSDHAALPLGLDEIVQSTIEAVAAGASLLHLHIRDNEGQHSLNPDRYKRTIDALENEVGGQIIIQITSEAAGKYSAEQQTSCIKAVKPSCVSIALRELVHDKASLKPAQSLFHWCTEHTVRVQYILYSADEVLDYFYYLEQDIIPNTPHSILFVLGRYAKNQSSLPQDLSPYLTHQTRFKVPWMVCAFGAAEQHCLLDAAQKGGHMRLGFENNLFQANGNKAISNADQISALAEACQTTGIQIANITYAKHLLNIK